MQSKTFAALSLSTFSHHMVRWAKARGYNFNDFQLKICPATNPQDFNAIASEIVRSNNRLKSKFECLSVIRRLVIGSVDDVKQSKVISRLFQCLVNLSELSMECCSSYINVMQYCGNLRRLEIDVTSKQISKFTEAFQYCKQLEHFGLTHCCLFESKDFVYHIMCAIIVHSDALQSLSLRGLNLTKAIKLLNAFKTRRLLQALELYGTSIKELPIGLFIRSHGSSLKHLMLGYPVLFDHCESIGEFCPQLTSVDLGKCFESSDILFFLNNARHLKSFRCQIWSDTTTIAAYANYHTLDTLHISPTWTKNDIRHIMFKWENLIELVLNDCKCSTKLLSHCVKLRRLTVTGITYLYLEKQLPNLEILKLGVTGYLTNFDSPVSLKTVNYLPALNEVHCSGYTKLLALSAVVGSSVKVVLFSWIV